MKKCTRNDVEIESLECLFAESNAPLIVFVSLSFEEWLTKALPCLNRPLPAAAGGAGGWRNSGPGLGECPGCAHLPSVFPILLGSDSAKLSNNLNVAPPLALVTKGGLSV